MSGSVSPFTGASPADMVMLYSTWNVKPEMMPDHQIRAQPILGQPCRLERSEDHEQIQPERDEHAEKPCSSPSTEKTKSLWATGRNP